MSVLTRDNLREHVRRGETSPVYVLFGAETYLRDRAAGALADRLFGENDFRDFNDITFKLRGGDDDSLTRALSTARELPMMSAQRVVRITDVRISATGYRDTITEAHETVLKAYFDDPAPDTTVIFIADDLNGVRKVGKLLRERTMAVNFEPLRDDELLKWARGEFEKSRAEIDENALRFFVSRVGPSLIKMSNEIEKLATAALPDKRISAALVEELVANTREISNFLFTDQLIAGRGAEALATLAKTLDDGVEPVVLIGSISYAYRRLLMAKDMMDRGLDRREVASVVKLRYNDQESFLTAARRADAARLREAVRQIAAADLAIKTSAGGSGPAGARMQIEMLACKLAISS